MNEELTLALAKYVARLLVYVNLGGDKPKKPDGISWHTVYEFSKFHSLATAVFSAVEDEVKTESEPELLQKWDRTRSTDTAQHIKQSSEFASVTSALTKEQIPFLPLKGFTYKKLWKNPAHRTMSDMDIYFHPDDFPRVDTLLKSLGYSQEGGCNVHVNFAKKPFVKIEAHRRFVENAPAIPMDTWGTKPDNPYFHVMTHEQFLAFNALHAKKHFEKGGCGMRVVFDLYLYLNRFASEVDRPMLESELIKDGALEFFREIEELAGYWYGDALITEKIRKNAMYVATGGTYGSHENGISYGIEKKGKLGYVFSRVFPPYSHMKNRYPVLKPLPILLPVMYVVRFVVSIFNGRNSSELRGIKKHDKKQKKQ